MDDYDPFRAPDPEQWLELDDSDRAALVEEHHRRAKVRLPNVLLHSLMHVVVENQIAEREDVVVRAVERLQSEGLDRHEALHAVGSVLAMNIYQLMQAPDAPGDIHLDYLAEVEALTAERWRAQSE